MGWAIKELGLELELELETQPATCAGVIAIVLWRGHQLCSKVAIKLGY